MVNIQNRNLSSTNSWLTINRFTVLLTFIFFILGFLGIINHELWQDEMQAWMIAKDSTSISNLLENLKYEGHPALWYICLHILAQFTHNPLAMQIFHLLIATVTIAIFLKFAPFTKLHKVLFIFGYFPFYEYSILSRNYILGILLLFIFCSLFSQTKKAYFSLFLILALLAHINVFALIIAIVLTISFLLKILLDRFLLSFREKLNVSGGLSIAIASIIGAIMQLIPPDDGIQGNLISAEESVIGIIFYQLNNLNRFMELLSNIWKAYFPLYQFSFFWEIITLFLLFVFFSWMVSKLFVGQDSRILGYSVVLSLMLGLILYHQKYFWGLLNFQALLGSIIALIIISLASLLFLQYPIVLFLYISGSIGILLFTHLIYYSDNLRHIGHFYFLFLVCIWLTENERESYVIIPKLKKLRLFTSKYKNKLIGFILVIQLIAGSIAYNQDLVKPFSLSKKTAQYIQEKQWDKLPIVAIPNERVCVLSGYLNRKFYYPQSDRMGSFVIWNNQRVHVNEQSFVESDKKQTLIKQNIFEYVNRVTESNTTDVLLISTWSIPWKISGLKITQVKQFNEKTIGREDNYQLYLIEKAFRSYGSNK